MTAPNTAASGAAAPAPLDPSNPEDLRRMREAALKLRSEADEKEYAALGTVAIMLAAKIVHLDETAAAEKAQEADDRKRAGIYVADWNAAGQGAYAELALRVIRAERARQEGEK